MLRYVCAIEGAFWCRSVFSQTFSCSGHVYHPQNCGMSTALRRGRWAEGCTAEDCWARPRSVCRMEAKRCATGRQRRASGIYDATQGVVLCWVGLGLGPSRRSWVRVTAAFPAGHDWPCRTRIPGLKAHRTVESLHTASSPSEWEIPPCLCVSWEGRPILLQGTAWSCSPSSHPCMWVVAWRGRGLGVR